MASLKRSVSTAARSRHGASASAVASPKQKPLHLASSSSASTSLDRACAASVALKAASLAASVAPFSPLPSAASGKAVHEAFAWVSRRCTATRQ